MLHISLRLSLCIGLAVYCNLVAPTLSYAKPPAGALSDGPKTIASRDRVSVMIDREIEDAKSFIVLKISVPTDSTINAFLLPDPPRLVVDFEGASIKKNENFAAPPNGVIKQVRLGAHANKLRVVVDLIKTSTPEYDWKAGKRQAIIRIVESTGPAAPTAPTQAPSQPAPTAVQKSVSEVPTVAPTTAPTQPPATATAAPKLTLVPSPTFTLKPVETPAATQSETPTLSDVEKEAPPGAVVIGGAPPAAGAPKKAELPNEEESLDLEQPSGEPAEVLGDAEGKEVEAPPAPKVSTAFSIKGYKFEYLPDKTPVLKILLNKPRAEAQISKVDSETYSIKIKDCGLENDDLELPQFPPHDFVGFVMVVAERVGKDVEVSVSTEEDMVLGTSMHDQEIWVKKP